jgi:GT2 family glycosyltransferase
MSIEYPVHNCSIIIVNWNGKQFLSDCLTALRAQTFADFEVIFVDNASTDASLPLARQMLSTLNLHGKCIELGSNVGFAAGNNEGLKYASGRYVVLLNTDTVAEKDWLAHLAEAMESHPDVGICASKLVVHGENVIDSAGDGFSTFGHAFKRGEGGPPDCFSEQEYVLGACAGAAMYRREMIQQIGFFDEDFFLIFEDTDLNLRAQLNGWKCLYVPDAIVSHRVGGSMKKISHKASYYAVRNDKIAKIKNLPFPVVIRQLPFLILGEVIWFFYYIINGRFRYYLKANIDVLKVLPVYMKKRREVMSLKKVPDRYINNLLTSGFRLYGFKRIRRYLAL